MDVTRELRPEGIAVIGVTGDIDLHTAPQLREAIADVSDAANGGLVIDLDRVDFLDSTGLGVLVAAWKKVRVQHGSLQLVCSDERILGIFRVTGLANVFSIHPTVTSACREASQTLAGCGS